VVFGRSDNKHRVSVLRTLPYAMAQNPHLKLVRYNRRVLFIGIDRNKRDAWRRRLVAAGRW
jgi:hypothetical protein